MFRRYESVDGGEWRLKVDAEITTHFTGWNYFVELVYDREFRGIKCRRFMKTGRSLRTAWFSPGWVSRGKVREITAEDYYAGLAPRRSSARTRVTMSGQVKVASNGKRGKHPSGTSDR